EGNIERIFPRTSVLPRPTVANVDLGLVVFALKDPAPNRRLLDRMLVILEQAGLSAVICFNKSDLTDEAARLSLGADYERIGYPVVYTCTTRQEGREALLSALRGHITTMVGPSGAGKSSLVNMLSGESTMEVGEVSDKIRRGKQTTRHVQLVEIEDEEAAAAAGTYIVDTPGFSSLEFFDMEKRELASCFPEIANCPGVCKYASCSHLYEPVADCAIRKSVEAGGISQERYESYRMFYEEIAEAVKY
ncbi:MAG: ribosome small subunit-dependent GTPase A, partial [Lachnospiraceae bacterium]|nr:ribosome small subunit-dependent GTPase A [Lachnospiraceae bacterium]